MKGWVTVNLKREMKRKYPMNVCIDCLHEAYLDTIKYENRMIKWGSAYGSFTDTCQVCGQEKECAESSDAGYPTFDYVYLRLRAKKINKLLKTLE